MTIRLAIVGAGWIGDIHAKAIKNQVNAELVGVVENIEEKAKLFANNHGISRTFSSLEELIDLNIVDAVVICTPNYLHSTQSISALKAGLHVLVEKPMATSVEEATKMYQASIEASRVLMVGHCWRHDTEVKWMRDQIVDQKLGKIIRTKGYGIHKNWGPSGWFTKKELSGGGALVDMGIHPIDTVRYMLGDPEPVSVYAKIGTYYGDYDVDDTGVLIITWNCGTVSYIEFGWWQPYSDGPEAATQLFGTQGYGSVFPTSILPITKGENELEKSEVFFKFPRVDHAEQVMYDHQMSHFLSTISTAPPLNQDALISITNMKILEAAYKSNFENKIVWIAENFH